jgi:hypothetical protein
MQGSVVVNEIKDRPARFALWVRLFASTSYWSTTFKSSFHPKWYRTARRKPQGSYQVLLSRQVGVIYIQNNRWWSPRGLVTDHYIASWVGGPYRGNNFFVSATIHQSLATVFDSNYMKQIVCTVGDMARFVENNILCHVSIMNSHESDGCFFSCTLHIVLVEACQSPGVAVCTRR